ncbi:MAG: hypothetical protein DRJ29_03745 [Bacteroidetes bacterium]|nr:MAG: hypothetical protein DRJ29_03745 [Bacteroidota bacterium]RLE01061.1 MAG: hypothetical protein DRJ13_07525 [Bacteroidota bacterium]
MKKVMIPMVAVLTLLFLNSFMMPDIPKEEVRKLDAFSGIGISVSADVYYTPGNTHEITIEGDSKDVDDLITEVKNGFLQVKYPNSWRTRHSKLTIYITSKELDAVKISGSAKFKAGEPITTDEMDLAMSGSGGIQFKKLNADEVDVSISGSGSIELLDGNADELDVRISGSGKLNAEAFEVNEFSASISGSGSIRITAKEELEARISGSGKVYYHGTPRVNSSSSGSGKVVAL